MSARPPIRVEATRDGMVEAVHEVHAVALADGRVVASAGDPGRPTYLRSAAKPLQALQLARARPGLDDRELAIACASHRASAEQLEVVRALLAAAPAGEDELETGPEPTPLEHNCSGKHAGFLAVCRAHGIEASGYRRLEHPLQREILAEVADAAGVAPAAVGVAIDGCGVPTFALPLESCARAFGALPELEGGTRVVAAMRAHPELLRGPIAADARLIRTMPGWVGKGGAEALFCARSDDGLAVALKVADGSYRGILPALARFLSQQGIDTGDLHVATVENSRGEPVGTLRAV